MKKRIGKSAVLLLTLLLSLLLFSVLSFSQITFATDGIKSDSLLTGNKPIWEDFEYATVPIQGAEDLSYSGILVRNPGYDYVELGSVNLSNSTVETPIISILPQFVKGSHLQSYTDMTEYYQSNKFDEFYVEFVSSINPSKKLTYRFKPRLSDKNGETSITAAGENQKYYGISWADKNTTLAADFAGTQKFRFDGTFNENRTVKDENDQVISDPHPINLYYDYESNTVYSGSGVTGTPITFR